MGTAVTWASNGPSNMAGGALGLDKRGPRKAKGSLAMDRHRAQQAPRARGREKEEFTLGRTLREREEEEQRKKDRVRRTLKFKKSVRAPVFGIMRGVARSARLVCFLRSSSSHHNQSTQPICNFSVSLSTKQLHSHQSNRTGPNPPSYEEARKASIAGGSVACTSGRPSSSRAGATARSSWA